MVYVMMVVVLPTSHTPYVWCAHHILYVVMVYVVLLTSHTPYVWCAHHILYVVMVWAVGIQRIPHTNDEGDSPPVCGAHGGYPW